MNEEMNIPEAVPFLLNQQAQFYSDLHAMREQFANDMQAMREQSANDMQRLRDVVLKVTEQQLELTQTVNTIAAAHLRAEQANAEAHRRLEEAQQRVAEAHTLLELRAAETEEKLNALIDIVSRQQPPLKENASDPPAPDEEAENPSDQGGK
jgi:hypothetical protein